VLTGSSVNDSALPLSKTIAGVTLTLTENALPLVESESSTLQMNVCQRAPHPDDLHQSSNHNDMLDCFACIEGSCAAHYPPTAPVLPQDQQRARGQWATDSLRDTVFGLSRAGDGRGADAAKKKWENPRLLQQHSKRTIAL
jgi:hypothetical protein